MGFADVLEQEGAKRQLQAVLRSRQVPGALLFQGPWGVGKTRTALAFARALNCETAADDACDACPSCKRALKFAHRDIRFIFPWPAAGKPEEIEVEEADAMRGWAGDPWYLPPTEWAKARSEPGSEPRSTRFASISIDKVREMKRAAGMSLAEGRAKVFVVREADRMLAVQQNALLKLLEEPPPSTHLILTTARPQALLSTIVSRCQVVSFAPLSAATIARALVEARGVSAARARIGAGMAAGSLGRALLLAGEDVEKVRADALALLATALAGGPGVATLAQELAQARDRSRLRLLTAILALWHGDLLKARARVPAERLANPDRAAELAATAQDLSTTVIRQRIELCEALIEAIDQSANLSVAVYWFLVGLADPAAARVSLLAPADEV